MAAHQALPSMGFSRQEYWSGLPLPSPEMWKLDGPGTEPMYPPLVTLNNGPQGKSCKCPFYVFYVTVVCTTLCFLKNHKFFMLFNIISIYKAYLWENWNC